jgi:hypothetical protein
VRKTHHEFPKALLIALWIILVLIPVLVPSARASLCLAFGGFGSYEVKRWMSERVSRWSVV